MLSTTLATGLEQYRIGPKLRALRLAKKLKLAELNEHTGLSLALLSKIERGQLFPTLPTLLRIAMVFGVGLEHFFVESERPRFSIIRSGDRLRLPARAREKKPSYYFESLDFPVAGRKMEAFFADFPANSKQSDAHAHPGVELIYIIKGRLAVVTGEAEISLKGGDALHFESGAPHSYRCEGPRKCTAIVVVAK